MRIVLLGDGIKKFPRSWYKEEKYESTSRVETLVMLRWDALTLI